MRVLLTLSVVLLFAVATNAQTAPLQFTNNIGCHVWVYADASPGGCATACTVGPICVAPGATVFIPPCIPGFGQWDLVKVTSVDQSCTDPCPGIPGVASPVTSGCAPVINGGVHCYCGPYTVDFSFGPNQAMIY